MNDLLKASKSVVDYYYKDRPIDNQMRQLHAAVVQFEKQKSEYFDEWMQNNATPELQEVDRIELFGLWYAAQQAERRRMVNILYEVCKYQENFDLIIEKMYE